MIVAEEDSETLRLSAPVMRVCDALRQQLPDHHITDTAKVVVWLMTHS
jgi:hypothetical protein